MTYNYEGLEMSLADMRFLLARQAAMIVNRNEALSQLSRYVGKGHFWDDNDPYYSCPLATFGWEGVVPDERAKCSCDYAERKPVLDRVQSLIKETP